MLKKILLFLNDTAHVFTSELKETFLDAGAFLIFIIAMVAYPVAYSIGYVKETVREIPVAVVDLDHTALSRQYSRMADATEQVKTFCKSGSLDEAEQLFYAGKVDGIVLIPDKFEKDVLSGKQTNITVYCDAGHLLLYKQVFAANSYASGMLNAGIVVRNLMAKGKSMNQALVTREPLEVETYNLFNPSGGYGTFVVPSILLIVIQQTLVIGIGLLFGKNYEKRKNKHFIEMLSRLGRSVSIVVGKSFSYVFVYLFTTLFLLGFFYRWLHFPDKNSFLEVYYLLIPFLFAVAFMAIAIGVLFRKRVQPLLFIVFISPTVYFLSGASWPVQALPGLLKGISYVLPTTPMIDAFFKLRICGADLHSLSFEWNMLFIQMIVYFILACLAIKFGLKDKPLLETESHGVTIEAK